MDGAKDTRGALRWVVAAWLCVVVGGCAGEPAELQPLLGQIDDALVRQCTRAIRSDMQPLLDAQVAGVWRKPPPWYAVKPWSVPEWVPPRILVEMKYGGVCGTAGRLLDLHESTGDRAYLTAARKTCDLLVRTQRKEGYWPLAYLLEPDGREVPMTNDVWVGRNRCRFQDGYQYAPFNLMLNAWRVTGNRRYLRAAVRCGDLVLNQQLPCGGWPDYVQFGPEAKTAPVSSYLGSRLGPSWNDGATSFGLRMMFTMYHLTGDTKYLRGTRRLGQWLIDSQIGMAMVRGWADQYGPDLRPIAARSFEGTQIEPRVFNRFTGPMLAFYYAMTGRQRYLTLLRETYAWLRSVEQPDGWAAEYTPDGRACSTVKGKLCLYDDPSTWPPTWKNPPAYSRNKTHLGGIQKLLEAIDRGGRAHLRERYRHPVPLSAEAHVAARAAAARRAIDPQRVADVRAALAKPLPAPDPKFGKHRTQPRKELVAFVRDVRIARGRIGAEVLAEDGSLLRGDDRIARAMKVTDRINVPLPPPETPAGNIHD